jgi:hypothetical protein
MEQLNEKHTSKGSSANKLPDCRIFDSSERNEWLAAHLGLHFVSPGHPVPYGDSSVTAITMGAERSGPFTNSIDSIGSVRCGVTVR